MDERLAAILASFEGRGHELIPLLQQVQREFGYLRQEDMREVARFVGVPESQVYAVATFYAQFRFRPIGRQHIMVCRGTACHVRGAPRILQEIEKQLGIKEGETTRRPRTLAGDRGLHRRLRPVALRDDQQSGRGPADAEESGREAAEGKRPCSSFTTCSSGPARRGRRRRTAAGHAFSWARPRAAARPARWRSSSRCSRRWPTANSTPASSRSAASACATPNRSWRCFHRRSPASSTATLRRRLPQS